MSFKDELNQNTKTPQQVIQENNEKIDSQIRKYASIYCTEIREKLLSEASKGKYQIVDGSKHISYFYDCQILLKYITVKEEGIYINKTLFNPGGQYAIKVSSSITSNEEYRKFIKQIENELLEDDIKVSPIFVSSQDKIKRNIIFSTVGFGEMKIFYTPGFQCEINY